MKMRPWMVWALLGSAVGVGYAGSAVMDAGCQLAGRWMMLPSGLLALAALVLLVWMYRP